MLYFYQQAGLGHEPDFAHRLRRHWELRELDGLAFAIRTRDAAELADAIRKLRAGPILAGPSRPN